MSKIDEEPLVLNHGQKALKDQTENCDANSITDSNIGAPEVNIPPNALNYSDMDPKKIKIDLNQADILDPEVLRSYTDCAWKEALRSYFKQFIAICWPEIYHIFDWSRGYEFLEQEFFPLQKSHNKGKKLTDKLIKLWTKEGKESLLLVHLEVEGDSATKLSQRMFTYYYHIYDRYVRDQPENACQIISIAILIDNNKKWRPSAYTKMKWEFGLEFKFKVIKILDFESEKEKLKESHNPFAQIILMQLEAIQAAKDPRKRKITSAAIAKKLYHLGYNQEQIIKLHHFLRGVMALPKNLLLELYSEVKEYEGDINVSYMTFPEEVGYIRGRNEGRTEGRSEGRSEGEINLLISLLKCKFNELPLHYLERIKTADSDHLLELGRRCITLNSLEEIFE